MRRRQRSFVELLVRSLAFSGLLYAVVFVYAVQATLLSPDSGASASVDPGPGALDQLSALPTWRPVHAKRFPGCVDMARWTQSHVPASVVVVRRDGDLARLQFDEAFRRAKSPSSADDVWTIGACG